MSSYTMQLREYIEMFSQEQSLSTRDKIEAGRTKLFDFDYPIFDPAYKNVFETHFIRKFYMREIGFETEGLFKFQLESWLLINMPYFNKLFESELLEFDPLLNSSMKTTYNKTNDKTQNDNRDITQTSTTDGTSNTTTDQTSTVSGTSGNDTTNTVTDDHFDRQLESNNPDGRLALTAEKGNGVIEYASNIKENVENDTKTITSNVSGTNDSTSTDHATNDTTANASSDLTGNDKLTSAVNTIEDYVQTVTGKTGSQTYSKMLMEYRESLLRIENKIFDEMNQLFMLVY